MSDPSPMGAVGRARLSIDAIRTIASMRKEGRICANPDEKLRLHGWSGWGPLAPMFAPPSQTWLDMANETAELLPADDLEIGRRSTYSAFYTPPAVAAVMWRILTDLGFTTGPVLEPGCGGGVFLRTAPSGADMHGVDRDPTAAAITQALYPDAVIHASPYERARLDGNFAAAIGNVPFGKREVADPTAPKACRASLHNYFIHRTMRELAPGGVAVLLTSRYTMDATADFARDEISELADFVGAIRLPNGALGGGTQALADIVVLRRKTEQQVPRSELDNWRGTTVLAPGASISSYWSTRPDMVLGDLQKGETSQHGLIVKVDLDLAELPGRLDTAADLLFKRATDRALLWQPPVDPAFADFTAEITADGWHEGSVRQVGRDVIQMVNGQRKRIAKPSKELTMLMGLRDLAVRLVELESDHDLPDAEIDPVRRAALACYQAYVAEYGAVNRCTIEVDELPVKPGGETTAMQDIAAEALKVLSDDFGLTDFVEEEEPSLKLVTPRLGGFRKDPDFQLVAALEKYDEDTGEHEPAAILTARQNRRIARPTRTDDPLQALAWSLDRNAGRVDLGFIAQMLDRPVLGITDVLGDAVYCDPETRQWVTAAEYLSENVREKLRTALVVAATDEAFERNVTALQAVLPKWLDAHEIHARLGMVWVDVDVVGEFVEHLLGHAATIKRLEGSNRWEVKGGRRGTPASSVQWGTESRDAYDLIQDALNNRTPVVRALEMVGDREVTRKDREKSMLAAQKLEEIQTYFGEWLWSDVPRAERLVAFYNNTYNALVARQFDGSHLTFPGLAPWFKPYQHQVDFVARGISTRASLCAHPVGAGKTATMAMLAMKLRELGLARNPMIAVPKHLLDQTARQMRQLFPAARILAVSSESIGRNRRAFAAKVATGDWDIVIITHPAFDKLRVSEQTEARYLQRQQSHLDAAIRAASPTGALAAGMVKAAAKRSDQLDTQVKKLRQRAVAQDAGITFEQLGVSVVFVDEAHYYKSLQTEVSVDGFSVKPSKRALDLAMKLFYLSTVNPGPYAALFTGTPISNTMLELYVMLRYLMQDRLQSMGLGSADAWAATFVQFVTSVDVTVDGGSFNLKTKPALFVNAPELRLLLSMVASIATAEQLGLDRPESVEIVDSGPPTVMQQEYSQRLVERVEEIRAAGPYGDRTADNMLKVCSNGRWMATDPRLVGLHDPEPGKLHRVAANILRVWRENPQELQIVFCDIGTPNKSGPQTYGRLRDLLVAGGMPAGRVEFIHSAKNGLEKAALFSRCRTGKVSVIMGSTDKLGVGTNIQTRVVAVHHVDAPFRPSDVEQRDGRALRPGNRHKQVFIFRYITQRTFDAYMWQLLTRKIGFITQMMSGVLDRTVEDVVSDLVLSYAAIKASATDQPLLVEKTQVESDVKRLRSMERAHRLGVDKMRYEIAESPAWLAERNSEMQMWAGIAADYTDRFGDADLAAIQDMIEKSWDNRPRRIAGMNVSRYHWYDAKSVSQPLIEVRGGNGRMWKIQMQSFHKADDFLRELRWCGNRAQGLQDGIARQIAEHHKEIASAKRVAEMPFAHAAELTAAQARLDQIDAELHDAATKADQEREATDGDRKAAEEREAEVLKGQLEAAVNGLLGSLRDELTTAVNDLLASLRQ